MYNVIKVGCGRCVEIEKLGFFIVMGINRNKEYNKVLVMVGFKVDSCREVINIGNRKWLIFLILFLFMIIWVRRLKEGFNKEGIIKIYLGNVFNYFMFWLYFLLEIKMVRFLFIYLILIR